ncbi:unnamed protein product [Spirodela intermedia]|uniref:Uncharacterized protein n=1 Tax=Spirodela intermedia TaxID=51605 RepID=A0A7I8KML4_SPIIN|nr:unnamed protein product [Spirodela intermedia]
MDEQKDRQGESPLQGQIIEVYADVSNGAVSRVGVKKVCSGAPCGFSEASASSKDAEERSASMRKLLWAVILCVIFMSVEVVGGIKANSLAILTDAAHLLSDVAAFAISLFSLWAAGWEATPRQSYGFFRLEILGALVSIQLIWLLTGILVYEAIVRLVGSTGEVHGSLMFAVSAFGLVVNALMAVLLGHGHGHDHGDSHDRGHSHSETHGHTHAVTIAESGEEHEPLLRCSEELAAGERKVKEEKRGNINMRGAYLHVLGDCIQSVGVMIGGAVIWWKPEWKVIDLVCTLMFSAVVLATTIRMLRDILEVLIESTPREVDATRLELGLCAVDGVVAVHELHVWAITVGKVLLACHVTVTPAADADRVLDEVIGYIQREYNISHITIQIERQ